ncbi:MAG: hypothetical protein M3335_06900 [Actinomycetota bacterium]|nr:hypothetical protein [Actinomycetota bacterium]
MAILLEDTQGRQRLEALELALVDRADELAVFLVFDRPGRLNERPSLANTYFAQRCATDTMLEQIIEALRSVGAYVELFEDERSFIQCLAEGRHLRLGRELMIAYNEIGFGIGPGAFEAGRKALIPLVADSFGITCANSGAYPCALTLHKFHSFRLLEALGFDVPPVWHFDQEAGWVGGEPPAGLKVIAKSTFEAWSVGVTEDSVFVFDESSEERLTAITASIGQPVTVQEFVSGPEVCVPVFSCPERVVSPPVESILSKAPGDGDAVVTIDDNVTDGAISYRRFEAESDLMRQLRSSALEVFDLFELGGATRIDFRINSLGRPRLTDIAVSPGLEADGSVAGSLALLGFDHERFIRVVIAATLGTRGLLPA